MRQLGVSLLALLLSNMALAQDWRDVTTPAPGPPRSVGSYTAGCLQGAQALPLDGPGFQTMRRYRRRFFGHPVLLRYLHDLAEAVNTQGLGTLSIGDLGQARGGPTPSGHRSHQNGLDVDIWFLLLPNDTRLSAEERETISAPSMVSANRLSVNGAQWSPRQAQVLRVAASQEAVERIFVNAAIKQDICRQSPGAAWLQKLRPWWGHDDHFHVRLRCPGGEQECQKQDPIPAGDGCGAELAWWFTEEAFKPQAPKESVKVPLPAACDEILRR